MCADLGVYGAHCAHTYITSRRDIIKREWDLQRVGYMCMKADDFSDAEDSIDELCRISNLCDYATKDQIQRFKARMLPLLDSARISKQEQMR